MAIFVGAAMQRLTGMGFALVAAPFVVLMIRGLDDGARDWHSPGQCVRGGGLGAGAVQGG